MYGSVDRPKVMLPWEIKMCGQIRIRLRREDLSWLVVTKMKVLEEHAYNPTWDDKPWKPKPGAPPVYKANEDW